MNLRPARPYGFVPVVALACALSLSVRLENAGSQTPHESDQQINDFSLSGFGDKGKKNWDISGRSADMGTNDVKLKDVVGNLYGEQENIKVTADKGNYNTKEGSLQLEQNVKIATSSGATLTTDTLNWDRKNQLVSTKDTVNIERDNIIATSLGAVGHPDLNKVSLEKDVQVKINPVHEDKLAGKKAQNKIEITCDGPMEIDYQTNVATFKRNVKVDTLDATMYSDEREVFFTKSGTDAEVKDRSAQPPGLGGSMNSEVDKILAHGNVTIIRGDNVSRSEEATFLASSNKIVLSGKPKLVIYSTSDMGMPSGK